ncbi:MAG: sigma-70 family RNA polymerase sigma factor [Gimesia sp.]
MPGSKELQREITDADDEDLFLYIAVDQYAPEGKWALEELWKRHGTWLFDKCLKICNIYNQGNAIAADLASAAFTKAIDRAETYKPTENANDEKNIRRTRKWLGTIAQHLLIDGFRNPNRSVSASPVDFDIALDQFSTQDFVEWFIQQNDVRHSANISDVIGKAFEKLSNREQRVIIETIMQRDKSPSQNYVLRGASIKLANELGISPDSVRQIRKRALSKIKDALDFWRSPL